MAILNGTVQYLGSLASTIAALNREQTKASLSQVELRVTLNQLESILCLSLTG